MSPNRRRCVVALATAFACLALMAAPASATAHTVAITGGTLTIHNTASTLTLTRNLGGSAGSGCTSNVVADVVPDGTGHAGTIDATAFTSTEHLIFAGNHYVTTITRLASTSGTWGTSATGSINSLTLQVSLVIRAAADNSSTNVDCATTGTPLCTLRMTLHLGGTYANGPLSTAGATISLSTTSPATVTQAIGPCQVPWSSYNGGTATVAGLTGTM